MSAPGRQRTEDRKTLGLSQHRFCEYVDRLLVHVGIVKHHQRDLSVQSVREERPIPIHPSRFSREGVQLASDSE